MIKKIDTSYAYIIREMFGCGEGHAMTAGYTHWEAGEVCPMRHEVSASNEDVHLYDRLYAVPEKRDNEVDDMWEWMNTPKNRGKWCQNPLAPKGLKEGDRIEPQEA